VKNNNDNVLRNGFKKVSNAQLLRMGPTSLFTETDVLKALDLHFAKPLGGQSQSAGLSRYIPVSLSLSTQCFEPASTTFSLQFPPHTSPQANTLPQHTELPRHLMFSPASAWVTWQITYCPHLFHDMQKTPSSHGAFIQGLYHSEQWHPNPHLQLLQTWAWQQLLGRLGDELMLYLLLHGSIFVPLLGNNYLQVTGKSIYEVSRRSVV
jgi:hypothetical protein